MASKIVSPAYIIINFERIESAWVQHNKRGQLRVHAKIYSIFKHKHSLVRTKYMDIALADPWFRQFSERFNSYDSVLKVYTNAR